MPAHITSQALNFMLDSLEYFPTVGRGGMAVYAHTQVNGGGTPVASAIITFSASDSGKKTMSNSPTLTIPSANNILSLSIATYGSNVNTDINIIGYKNTVGDFTFPDGGVIKIDESTLELISADEV